MPSKPSVPPLTSSSFAAYVGIDWADRSHAVAVQLAGSDQVQRMTLAHDPQTLDEWANDLLQRFPGRLVAICVELSRGPLIHAFMKHPHLVIYPLPPAQMANYRRSFRSSGAKNDPTDAALILDYLLKHGEHLRPWCPDDAQTRELAGLVEHRRHFVHQRTAANNRLKAHLKTYFPQAIKILGDDLTRPMACAFLMKWSDLASLKRARPQTIRRFFHQHNVRRRSVIEERLEFIANATVLTDDPALISVGITITRAHARILGELIAAIADIETKIESLMAEHEDAHLFTSLPGAGEALAPRLLVAFGTDRDRYQDAGEVQIISGIAPVTDQSGNQCHVYRRWACPKFLRQSFHEFAQHSIGQSEWARAYYQLQLSRGKKHHPAVRALAFKWIRVLFACWKNRTVYDESHYLARLREDGSPLCDYLPAA